MEERATGLEAHVRKRRKGRHRSGMRRRLLRVWAAFLVRPTSLGLRVALVAGLFLVFAYIFGLWEGP